MIDLGYFDGLATASATRAVTAVATSPALLSIDASPFHNFNDVVVNGTALQTFTITNNGGADATALAINGIASPYSITATTCAATLAPAASCTVDIEFAPTSLGLSLIHI